MENIIYSAIGKRKTSVAKIFLKKGTGQITINQQNLEVFPFNTNQDIDYIKKPLAINHFLTSVDIQIFVKGGGISSQLDAIRLAISKALCLFEKKSRSILKKNLFLRRDSRIKERRKYGLKKARKASQYSKR